jgi:protein-S-isoprenylcysteine O-methyltransferase Ste14
MVPSDEHEFSPPASRFSRWLWISNLVMTLLYLRFAWVSLEFMKKTPQISTAVQLAFCTLAAVLFALRRGPKSESRVPLEWFCAVGGTFAVLLFRPVQGHDGLVLTILQVAGMLVSITGLASLGRSFGIVPANRGVQRSGLYRLVRHPMYAGYVMSYSCFVLQNPSLENGVLLGTFIAFTILRIVMEEGHLSKDPLYREMQQQVRWRLMPFVW